MLGEPNRRLFLNLLLQGFRLSETALNALRHWKICSRLAITRATVVDADMLDIETGGISDSDVEYFQFIAASIRMVVDLSVANYETPSKSAAVDAVKYLVQTGWDRRMYGSLATPI